MRLRLKASIHGQKADHNFVMPGRDGHPVLSGKSCVVQVTGEACYADDVKLSPDFLHAALVVSSKPYARILSVDPAAALKVSAHNPLIISLAIPSPKWSMHDTRVRRSFGLTEPSDQKLSL